MRSPPALLLLVGVVALCGCHEGGHLATRGSACVQTADCLGGYVCDPATHACDFATDAGGGSLAEAGPGTSDAPVSSGDGDGLADAGALPADTTDGSVAGSPPDGASPGIDVSLASATCEVDAGPERCEAGYGRCGGSSCGVFLPADPDNCGQCGHSCGDGDCLGGNCQPKRVFSIENARKVAVNQAGLYWTTSAGEVLSLPFGSTNPPRLLATGEGKISALVVDDKFAYFVAGEGKCTGPLGGCLRKVKLLEGNPSIELTIVGQGTGSLAVDDKAVYWYDANGGVLRLSTHDDSAVPEPIADTGGRTLGLAIDRDYIYWADWSDTDPGGAPTTTQGGLVNRARLDGTEKRTLVAGVPRIGGIAVDDWNVYWTEYQEGNLKMAPKDRVPASPVTPLLLAHSPAPAGVLSDGVNVYWTSPELNKVPRCGGESRVVASGYVEGIARWNQAVYYSIHPAFGSGAGIFRLAQ
jgi:hypothetical protein